MSLPNDLNYTISTPPTITPNFTGVLQVNKILKVSGYSICDSLNTTGGGFLTIIPVRAFGDSYTYSGSDMWSGLVLRQDLTAHTNDTFPTAIEVLSVLPYYEAGSTYNMIVQNDSLLYDIQSISPGTGITLFGATDIIADSQRYFAVTASSVDPPAVSIATLGTSL